MDIIFLYSNEKHWEKNLLNLRTVVGNRTNIIPFDAKGRTKRESFKAVADSFEKKDEKFIIVEGDNWVFENFVDLIGYDSCCKVFAESPYGFKACHGGIKILTADHLNNSLMLTKTEHDLSVHMNLPVKDDVAYSRHSFDESNYLEFKVVAKEIVKLYFWGNHEQLNDWKCHPRSKRICDVVLSNITKFNLDVMISSKKMNDLLDDLYYKQYFKVAILGIMKNEERHIQRYVQDHLEFDKIFLLDTGSTDETINLIRDVDFENKVEVFTNQFEKVHYGDFRSKLMELIKDKLDDYDFIFWVDIDESPMYERCSIDTLKRFLANSDRDYSAFEITRQDISGSPPFNLQRIFRSADPGYWVYQIHEQHRFVEEEVWHRPLMQVPFYLLHLESERIQTLEKKQRYSSIITECFKEAEAKDDYAAIYHYLFFYIDILANECNTEGMMECYEKYIKPGKFHEFPGWYLRRYLFYFVTMGRDDLVEELLNIVKGTEHYEQLISAKDAVLSTDKEESLKMKVDKSTLVNYSNNEIAHPIDLVISLTGQITDSLAGELTDYFERIHSYFSANFDSVEKNESTDETQFNVRFRFTDHIEFYKFFGDKSCSFNLHLLTYICVRNNLRRNVFVQK